MTVRAKKDCVGGGVFASLREGEDVVDFKVGLIVEGEERRGGLASCADGIVDLEQAFHQGAFSVFRPRFFGGGGRSRGGEVLI